MKYLFLTALRAGGLLLMLMAGSTVRAHDQLPPGIDWVNGDVDRALQQAQSSQRPLFLYWGAVWCPPCNQLKAILFRRADFQTRLRAFVPVYLDGDEEATQHWGDRFHVVGYPTLLVLRADGTEVTRIPGEVDPNEVIHVLDLALQGGRPVTTILDEFNAGKALGDADWQLLATYGWELDSPLPAKAMTALLARLAEAAPARLEAVRGRLWLHALATLAPDSDPWASHGAGLSVLNLLTDATQVRANRDLLIQPPSRALIALRPRAPQLSIPLRQTWDKALQGLVSDASLSCTERLTYAWAAAELHLVGADPVKRKVAPSEQESARKLVAECDHATRDELERQSVISAASDLLQETSQPDEAARLIEAEIPVAHVPAYFMQERAALARHQDRGQEALDWSALAYANMSGGATRLQWAVRYIGDRIHYAPDGHATITGVGTALLREARELPDAFADRNLRSLKQLDQLLHDWSTAHPLPVEEQQRLRAGWEALCHARPAGAPAPSFCAAPSGSG